MRIGELWQTVRDFFSHERLEEAKKRHQRAADGLDAAVREILRK
jgi:hypothetical protein